MESSAAMEKRRSAHVGSAGRKSGDPGAHLTAAEEVFLFTAAAAFHEEIDSDAHHETEIDDEDNQFCIHKTPLSCGTNTPHTVYCKLLYSYQTIYTVFLLFLLVD